jgi:hypothetical protein
LTIEGVKKAAPYLKLETIKDLRESSRFVEVAAWMRWGQWRGNNERERERGEEADLSIFFCF